MLVEFTLENYRSFQERQTFSMVASDDIAVLRNNTFSTPNTKDLRLLTSAAIYGANASGKSNLLLAMHAMKTLVVNSASRMQAGDSFPIEPFRLNTESEKNPSIFEIIFVHKNIRYQYGVALNRKRVYEEWLIAFPNERQQNWFERQYLPDNPKTKADDGYLWSFGRGLKGEKERIKRFVRVNSLFLSHAAQNNHPQLTEVFEWFQKFLNVIDYQYSGKYFTLNKCQDDNFRQQIVKIINEADIGISDIRIHQKTARLNAPTENGKSGFAIFMDTDALENPEKNTVTMKDSDNLEAITLHKKNDSQQEVQFDLDEESQGTQRLFDISGRWIDVLQQGEILIVDEIDRSLHPVLSKALIKIFHNPEVNKKNAQLIFTTHDTTLLDEEMLRQDQIWFTEKDNSMTKLYSLLEFRPHQDESLQKGYLLGRYGAIPFISSLTI
jgi:uncharacterized protein